MKQLRYILYLNAANECEKSINKLNNEEKKLDDIIKRKQLNVIARFKEFKSSKDIDRPLFNKMMKMIDEGEADAIITYNTKELNQNYIDFGRLIWGLKKNSIKEIQMKDDVFHSGEEGSLVYTLYNICFIKRNSK